MRSGCNSRALSTASDPSRASPQICQPVSDESKRITPRRTATLSSAIRMRKEVMFAAIYPTARVGSSISSTTGADGFGTGIVTEIFAPRSSDTIVTMPCR